MSQFRNTMMTKIGGGGNPWERYVQNGLVFQLDCESGCTAESWLEIINGYLFTAKDIQIIDGVPTFNGTTSEYYSGEPDGYDNKTHSIEVCVKVDASTYGNAYFFYRGGQNTDIALGLHQSRLNIANAPGSASYRGILVEPFFNTPITFAYSGQDRHWQDAMLLENGSIDYPFSLMDNVTRIGRANTRWLRGTIYAIRIYNRHLTKEELEANRAIDLERFGNR